MEFKVTHFSNSNLPSRRPINPICIFTTLLLLLGSSATFAQSFSGFDAGLRVAGAVNNSYGLGTDRYYSKPMLGASAGLYATYLFRHNTYARVEALISSRGFNGSAASSPSSTSSPFTSSTLTTNTTYLTYTGLSYSTFKRRALYLDVPFGIDYEVYPRITIQAGGMISLFLKEYKNEESNQQTVNSQSPKDLTYYQYLQGAIYVGAGYQFDFGLTAGVRGTVGLSNTFVASSYHSDSQIIPYSAQIFASYSIFKLKTLIKTHLL
jgi:Outer membrane protein beta-barrel domain